MNTTYNDVIEHFVDRSENARGYLARWLTDGHKVFVTLSEARLAASARGITAAAAPTELRKAAAAPLTTQYNFFLSHTREDAAVVAGVKTLLEGEGWTVYVYWAEGDATTRVNAETAAALRKRMNDCQALIYASSEASPSSKWMPWELGYFDGRKPGRVAIMPLPSSAATGFRARSIWSSIPISSALTGQMARRASGFALVCVRARLLADSFARARPSKRPDGC